MARSGRPRIEDRFSFGGRVPWAIGLVLVVTIGLSLLVAVGSRHGGGSLFEWVALEPASVWRGQVWRLATWTFVEDGPLALIFAVLFLYWFGGDLANELGSRRFLLLFGGIMLAAAVGTCLVAVIDPAIREQSYLGGWAASTAMIVAWGFWFPHRVIRVWFVIPIRAIWLAWLTLGITVACVAYFGWERYLPEMFAEAGIMAWLFGGSVSARWRRLVGAAATARRDADRRARRAKAAADLRTVESLDDDPPPLPDDLDAKLRDILDRRR
jgi:membrane associated rhomboid family serine protease